MVNKVVLAFWWFQLWSGVVQGICRKSLNEGGSVQITCQSHQYIEFSCGAYYGTSWYCSGYDSTVSTLNGRCSYASSCLIYAGESWFGNPCWGADKKLEYTYECRESWTPWRWSCPTNCRAENITRTRSCLHPHGCTAPSIESVSCLDVQCPRDGEWGEWGSWSDCPISCTVQNLTRSRMCDNPRPLNGGSNCTGTSVEHTSCLSHGCPRNGGWSVWSAWSDCPENCIGQFVQRNRTCDNPPVLNDGLECIGNETDIASCHMIKCKTNGNWGEWSEWPECPNTCRDDQILRNRTCDNPFPLNGGHNCSGNDTESRDCVPESCQEDDHIEMSPDSTSLTDPKKKFYYIGGGIGGCLVSLVVATVVIWKIKIFYKRKLTTKVHPFQPPTTEV